jgi:mono/diheme cytochrome c family protein
MRDPSGHAHDGRGQQVIRSTALLTALLVLGGPVPLHAAEPSSAGAQAGALLPRDSRDAAVFRGGLVYTSYCVTCHGINADGNGRAARLYTPRPANLRTSDKNDAYVELIIRKGGEAIGRSAKMPPWEEELTNEQVRDVVAFIRSINAQ